MRINLPRWLAGALLVLHLAAPAQQIVRFPVPEFEGDRRYDYPIELLKLALAKTGKPYRVEPAKRWMNQARQVAELEAGRSLDVAPIPSSAEREARLRPVLIPLNRGLLGWRLGLVRKADSERFVGVKSLADLRSIRIAQGHEWPDTLILRGNRIEVITGATYEGLFKMLATHRFDYFPRSVMEIWNEQANNADTMVIEPHLVLHYPYDSYFFVNRHNTALHDDLSAGLERALADGSFNALFQKHFGERLRRARLHERTIIEMSNPELTPQAPLHRPELWYDPAKGK